VYSSVALRIYARKISLLNKVFLAVVAKPDTLTTIILQTVDFLHEKKKSE